MNEVEPTFDNMRHLAWSIYWRSALLGMLAGFVVGFIIGFCLGFIAAMTGNDMFLTAITPLSFIAGMIAGFFVFVWVLTKQIGKTRGQHRLVLVQD